MLEPYVPIGADIPAGKMYPLRFDEVPGPAAQAFETEPFGDVCHYSWAAEMPWRVRELLLAGFCAREADQAIRVFGAKRGAFPHAGDSPGAVPPLPWRP